MDIKKVMILVKGEDKTQEISNIDCDLKNKKVEITYKGGITTYAYNQSKVVILENPKVIEINGHAAYVDDMPVYEPQFILDFGKWIRIVQKSGKILAIRDKSFSLVKNGVANQDSIQILDYLKDISQYTADNLEEEAFLKQEMEQLTFIHPESVLSCYLNGHPVELRNTDTDTIIFPFRFNLSQKTALENSLTSSISVIEGPPGTGKTQTILNIIANLVAIHGKSVAVVSNNNEAVKNVIEKMTKQGYGFLTAFLGKGSNQDTFLVICQ
ncbi:AAA domain-containing protein [Anaerocolumna sedimenticola]|uniref:AAA domain-containing protein n=1 Tax=Anaerocolumna sedimenticola TaxID=2696063 RepID=UPI001FE42BAC|nr:AAA domain-containing protein [Anaerocolumna sedimenticola]